VNFFEGVGAAGKYGLYMSPGVARLTGVFTASFNGFGLPTGFMAALNNGGAVASGFLGAVGQLEQDRQRIDYTENQRIARAIVKGVGTGGGGFVGGLLGVVTGAASCAYLGFASVTCGIAAGVAGVVGSVKGAEVGGYGADYLNRTFLNESSSPVRMRPVVKQVAPNPGYSAPQSSASYTPCPSYGQGAGFGPEMTPGGKC
jgi:hypothetical protein